MRAMDHKKVNTELTGDVFMCVCVTECEYRADWRMYICVCV